jgi:VanZ family protein
MGIIFYLSSDVRPEFIDIPVIHWGIYKILHLGVFATLYAAFFRAFYRTENHDMINVYMFSFIATVLYAASDELHQTYIPGRDGNPIDVAIDTLGASFVYLIIKANFERIKKFL